MINSLMRICGRLEPPQHKPLVKRQPPFNRQRLSRLSSAPAPRPLWHPTMLNRSAFKLLANPQLLVCCGLGLHSLHTIAAPCSLTTFCSLLQAACQQLRHLAAEVI